ncbi:MAG: type II secretion system F family protein [Acidimicrobiia bacterium]|nr:type II secretion system F family protein [Acidimicrobiia bacterium]
MTHTSTMDVRWRIFMASILACMMIVLAGPALLAQEAAPDDGISTTVRLVDTRSDPVAVVHTGSSAAPDVTAAVNGEPANSVRTVSAWDVGYGANTAIVIDTSGKNRDSLEALKESASTYVSGLAPNERVALVTTGATGRVLVPFTSNRSLLQSEIGTLESGGAFHLWDGVSAALDELERAEEENSISNVVIMAAGGDELSESRYEVIQGRLLSLDALVHVASINLRGLNVDELKTLTRQNGGSSNVVADTESFVESTDVLGSNVHGLYAVGFTSDQLSAGTDLDLTIDGEAFAIGYVPGSLATGDALERGQSAGGGTSVSFLTGQRGLMIGIGLGAAAIGLAVLAIGLLFQNDESALESMLNAYKDGSADGDPAQNALVNNAIFQRAVELTEQIAERQGALARTEEKLEQANLPFKAAEALMFYAASAVVSVLLAFVLKGDPKLAITVLLLGIVAPVVTVKFMAARRRKKFVSQLPDTLTLLAGTLKAGYSFMQGLESVSRESEDPIAEELRKVVTEAQLGRPVEEALDMSADRMSSDDYAWAIMAVKIQREVGGNLSELLMTVAETMTARERLRRDVASLTAEGRISAIVLGFLPFGLGAVMYVINPGYVGLLFSETVGNIMLGAGFVGAMIGFLWMKKLITIEI